MKYLLIPIAVLFILAMMEIYAMLVVASKADEEMEKYAQKKQKKNCLKCEHHYIVDKMVHGFYEIKCNHGEMRDYQVLACLYEEQIAKIKDEMIKVNQPKECPLLKDIDDNLHEITEML